MKKKILVVMGLAAQSPHGLFPIHAAFLNGYFWESIVSAVKPVPHGSGPTGPRVDDPKTSRSGFSRRWRLHFRD
ncbi:MAG: hypothetical protein DMF76_09525 [Acidobacteria bacterium]|nr:MAG: hypothetical protein DMF76_09525 [Acidobacteriota bacterium]